MIRYSRLQPEFVEYIPESLKPEILYVSMKYATAAHLCCCGCQREVVTPFAPTDWQLIFDGMSVSLRPSIGNWNFPCRSHYFIEHNRIIAAEPWSDARVAAERKRDRRAKARFYGSAAANPQNVEMPPPAPTKLRIVGFRDWLFRLRGHTRTQR